MRKLKQNNTPEALRILLRALDVKFTNYSIQKFSSHPDFPSLTSFNHILTSFGLENMAIRTSYEHIQNELPKPFLIHLKDNGGMYLVVQKVGDDAIYIINEDNKLEKFDKDEFIKSWSGIALAVYGKRNIQEKDFRINQVKEFFKSKRYYFGMLAFMTSVGYLLSISTFDSVFGWLFLLTKLIGLVVAVFLAIQFFDKNNPITKKICSAKDSRNTCLSVLNSKGSNFFGVISWSEIGLLYFTIFLLYLLLLPTNDAVLATSYLAVASALYIPYSLYYQWKVVKAWCRLCLLVQAVLFIELFVALAFLSDSQGVSSYQPFILLLLIAFLTMSVYGLVKPIIKDRQFYKGHYTDFVRIKFDREVFQQFLLRSPLINTSLVEPLILGDANSVNRITLITNPTCSPCIEAHRELFNVIANNSLQINEIFLPDQDVNSYSYRVAEIMLKLYKSSDSATVSEAIKSYYLTGKENPSEWINAYSNNRVEDIDVKSVLDTHAKWCFNLGVSSTPVLLFNNRVLPSVYKIEDIEYLLE